jgi:DNA-binding transcriptional LysR family regulator
MFEKLFSDRGLSFDRLRALVEIHDAGGIAQAAPGDPVRQSQYSRQLRELSEFFGVEVARRQGRQLRLSPQGVQLAELARTHFLSLQDFRAGCRAESVDYTIATGDSLIQWLVIPRMAEVVAKFPQVRFATTNLRTGDVVRQLGEGRADFGVIRRDSTGPLKSAALGRLTFTLVVPRALVPRRSVPTLDSVLAGLPVAAHTGDGQFTEKLRGIAEKLGREYRPALVCQSFPQALAAVRSGGFAAIMPRLALAELAPDSFVEVVPPEFGQLERELVLAWNARLVSVRPGAKKLIDHLQQTWRLGP